MKNNFKLKIRLSIDKWFKTQLFGLFNTHKNEFKRVSVNLKMVRIKNKLSLNHIIKRVFLEDLDF